MTVSLDTFLQDELRKWQPSILLSCGALLLPVVQNLRTDHPRMQIINWQVDDDSSSTVQLQSATFCVLANLLENHPKDKVLDIIAKLRNSLCSPIYLLHNSKTPGQPDNIWQRDDFLGAGFHHLGLVQHANQTLHCYGYSIQQYNKRRDWNNAQHWANPENFSKYRW